jgi:membrane protein involved in colicin uptake
MLAGVLLVLATAHADVYKYVDEKGNVQYTDRPEKLPANRLNIQSHSSDVVEINQRVGDDAKDLADRDKTRKAESKEKAEKKKDAEASAAGKAELCNKARQDYLNRMNAQRLYEELPNGERKILSDAEHDAARESARKAMEAMCN